MDDLLVGGFTIPAVEIDERFETSGGPGGQHANRSATAVRLRFDIASSSLPAEVKTRLIERLGEVVEASSSESRSQFRNRALARRRLRGRLEEALMPEPPPRRQTRPTRASKRQRVESKRARGAIKRLRRRPHRDD